MRRKRTQRLDKLDFRILELLLEDGRMTYKDLAKKVGIDERLASRRVEKLEREGIISGFAAILDWPKLGMGTQIYVGTRTAVGHDLKSKLFDFFQGNPNIIHVESTVGSYEYVFYAVCRDLPEFRSSIGNPLEPLTAGLSSSIVTSSVKPADLKPLLRVARDHYLGNETSKEKDG